MNWTWVAAISRWASSIFRHSDEDARTSAFTDSRNVTPTTPEEAMVNAAKHFSSAHKVRLV